MNKVSIKFYTISMPTAWTYLFAGLQPAVWTFAILVTIGFLSLAPVVLKQIREEKEVN